MNSLAVIEYNNVPVVLCTIIVKEYYPSEKSEVLSYIFVYKRDTVEREVCKIF